MSGMNKREILLCLSNSVHNYVYINIIYIYNLCAVWNLKTSKIAMEHHHSLWLHQCETSINGACSSPFPRRLGTRVSRLDLNLVIIAFLGRDGSQEFAGDPWRCCVARKEWPSDFQKTWEVLSTWDRDVWIRGTKAGWTIFWSLKSLKHRKILETSRSWVSEGS